MTCDSEMKRGVTIRNSLYPSPPPPPPLPHPKNQSRLYYFIENVNHYYELNFLIVVALIILTWCLSSTLSTSSVQVEIYFHIKYLLYFYHSRKCQAMRKNYIKSSIRDQP